MAASIASMSSLGDGVGHHETTLHVSSTGTALRESAQHNPSQDLANYQHEEAATRQRLLGEEDPKRRGHNVTGFMTGGFWRL